MLNDSTGATGVHPEIKNQPKAETRKFRVRQKVISAGKAPDHVYKTKQEVDAAIADGTFDIKRTQFIHKGKLFFLTYQ